MLEGIVPDGTVSGTPAPEGSGVPPELQGAVGAGAQLGWRAQLPDDLKTHEAFTPYKNVGELAKTYLDASGKLKELEGRLANFIPKPSENASPEEMAAYFTALGRPESPDKYEFEKPQLPEGLNIDPSLDAWFKQAAFEVGLNGGQASALYKQYMSLLGESYKAQLEATNKAREEVTNKLYQEWGDKKAENIETIKLAMSKFGTVELNKYFDETGSGNDPAMIKFFLSVGKAISEDSFVGGNLGDGVSRDLKTDPKTGLPIFEYPSMKENSGG